MYKTQKFTKNRLFIYHLLQRAKKFHMPISFCIEVDCTDAQAQLKELRRQGGKASFTAFMVKVTAGLLEQYPYLNSHLFTKWNGKKEIVQFEHINCNVVVQRTTTHGEKILLPLILREANKKSLFEIEELIQHHKNAPLEDLPQFQAYERIKKMPNLILSFISFKTRSDPDFYLKYYGTYGLSTTYSYKTAALSGSAVANTAVAFLPYNVFEQNGRKILRVGLVMDHFVLDGQQMAETGYHLKKLIEDPSKIISLS